MHVYMCMCVHTWRRRREKEGRDEGWEEGRERGKKGGRERGKGPREVTIAVVGSKLIICCQFCKRTIQKLYFKNTKQLMSYSYNREAYL